MGHIYWQPIKRMEEGTCFALSLLALALDSKSIPLLMLESPSFIFWHILKTSWDIQPCGLNNWILGLVLDSHCCTSL